jgi:hypothetical protein
MRKGCHMKTLGIALVFVCCVLTASAQSTNVELRAQALPDPALIGPKPTNRLQRVFGPTATYEGLLPDIKRRGNIITRDDFRGPRREFRNVSINPYNGRAEGVTLLAIRF